MWNNQMMAPLMGIGSGLGQLFGGGGQIGNSAMGHLDQIPGMTGRYLDPYSRGGQDAFGRLGRESQGLVGLRGPIQEQIMRMMQNPGGIMSQIGAGYQQSPGYKFQLGEAQRDATNAAAAGGMAGSPQHQQNAADISQNMASRDYNNYMQQALGLHSGGLGAGQNMYGMGFGGLGNMANMGLQAGMGQANIINQNQQNKAQMDFLREQMQRQQQMGGWGALLGGAGGLLGSMMNPGGMLGGGQGNQGGGQYRIGDFSQRLFR